MLTLRQLDYLDSVARLRHFGKAARECAISQPALSQQIRELEARLGVTLLERNPRQVSLTVAGEEIVRRAGAILAGVRDLTDYARQLGEVLAGPLRLGIIPSLAPYILPAALDRLQVAYPRAELRLRETLTAVLIEELRTGKLDAILVALPLEHRDLAAMPLFEDRFLLAVPANSPRAEWKTVTPDDIDPAELLLLEEGHCLRDQTLSYCNFGERGMDRLQGVASLSTIMQMVASGYGVTLLPELCARAERHDARVRLVPFASPQPSRYIVLAWRLSSPRRAHFEALGALFKDAVMASRELMAPESAVGISGRHAA